MALLCSCCVCAAPFQPVHWKPQASKARVDSYVDTITVHSTNKLLSNQLQRSCRYIILCRAGNWPGFDEVEVEKVQQRLIAYATVESLYTVYMLPVMYFLV